MNKVVKANALIEASYRLTLAETRVILSAIAQVRRDEAPTDEVLYEVRANALADVSGIAAKKAYEQLKDAAQKLESRRIRLYEGPNGRKSPRVTSTCWVQTVVYIPDEGRVELRFSRDVLPYLSQLREQYTRYELENVAGMRSTHGVRLYELLVQWRAHGEREIEIDEFRRLFGIEGRYPSVKDLKKYVLVPAVRDVNECSDLYVDYGQAKRGRRVSAFQFRFWPKKDDKPPEPTKAQIEAYAAPGDTWERAKEKARRGR